MHLSMNNVGIYMVTCIVPHAATIRFRSESGMLAWTETFTIREIEHIIENGYHVGGPEESRVFWASDEDRDQFRDVLLMMRGCSE